jgi:hypothetical protein
VFASSPEDHRDGFEGFAPLWKITRKMKRGAVPPDDHRKGVECPLPPRKITECVEETALRKTTEGVLSEPVPTPRTPALTTVTIALNDLLCLLPRAIPVGDYWREW